MGVAYSELGTVGEHNSYRPFSEVQVPVSSNHLEICSALKSLVASCLRVRAKFESAFATQSSLAQNAFIPRVKNVRFQNNERVYILFERWFKKFVKEQELEKEVCVKFHYS